jgi:hypothetical protein
MSTLQAFALGAMVSWTPSPFFACQQWQARPIGAPVGLGEPATTVVGTAIGNAIFCCRRSHLPIRPADVQHSRARDKCNDAHQTRPRADRTPPHRRLEGADDP